MSFSKKYSSDLSQNLVGNPGSAFDRRYPTLEDVAGIYGEKAPEVWVETQITGLDAVSGLEKGASPEAIEDFSRIFARRYRYMRVSEILEFVALFKLGTYGKFYSFFDVMFVGNAFVQYLRDRSARIEQIIREKSNRRVDDAFGAIPDGYTSLSWYNELKDRADRGDMHAKEYIESSIKAKGW